MYVSEIFAIQTTGSYVCKETSGAFSQLYEDPQGLGNKIFTGSVFPNKFELKHFLVIECKKIFERPYILDETSRVEIANIESDDEDDQHDNDNSEEDEE